MVAEVIALLSTAARQKGIALATHVGDAVPGLVLADPVRLRQVLLNLAGNALKFTEEGHVGISLEADIGADGALLRFKIQDTGIGIDKETTGDLFAPFTQADLSTQRRFGGTGLGLAIARHLVELMGARSAMTASLVSGASSTFRCRRGSSTPRHRHG